MSSTPQIRSSLPLVRVGRAAHPAPTAGGWLTAARQVEDRRNRVGRVVGQTVEVAGTRYTSTTGLTRWLTFDQMWTIYRRVPDLRAAIDSVVRRVATWDWMVEPTVESDDPRYEAAQEQAEKIRRFLAAPNEDGETWQEIITKFLTDLLVFDQGALEIVRSRNKARVKELVAIRGCTVCPVVDPHGRVQGYSQDYGSDDGGAGVPVKFEREDLLYMRLYPTTAGPEGNSLIEAIVDEVLTLLHASRHVLDAYDADELPPGVLLLSGLLGDSANRIVQDFRNTRGQDQKIRVITTPNSQVAGVEWVELRRTPKDLDMRAVLNDIRRIVWRVFGVLPVEMGVTEDVPRATAQVQLEVGSSYLVNPILELLETKVNARILPLLLEDPEAISGLVHFTFDREAKLTAQDEQLLADTLTRLVASGIMTRNEARARTGLPPVEYGDVLTVDSATARRLEDVAEEPEEEPEPPEDGQDDGEDPEDPEDDPSEGGGTGEGEEGPEGEGEAAPGESETEEEMSLSLRAKYDDINFTPPKGVQNECARGVKWYEEGHGGDGLVPESIRWARRLARGEDITPAKARKMRTWLARHEVDKEGEGFNPGEDGYPSPGRVAWALWGGDLAKPWSEKLVRQMDAADEDSDRAVRSPACRQDGETRDECVSRKVPEIMAEDPEVEQDQAVAIAESLCSKRCDEEASRLLNHAMTAFTNLASLYADPVWMPKCRDVAVASLVRVLRGRGGGKCCSHPTPPAPPVWTLAIETEMLYRDLTGLPSEWQSEGRFRDYRTLDLETLGDAVSGYARDVRPRWREARDEVTAALVAAWLVGRMGLTDEGAQRVRDRTARALDGLYTDWRVITEPRYLAAARVGRDAAVDFAGTDQIAEDWEQRAETYYQQAMGYLSAPDGPIEAVKRSVAEITAASERAGQDGTLDPEAVAEASRAALAAAVVAVEAAFSGNEHRIMNWSGRLVDLSNIVMVRALEEAGRASGVDGPVEWYAEWVSNSDERTCPTCVSEGSAGIRPLRDITRRPGGETECRARCRCVLVLWRRDEVESGKAIRLGPPAA